MTFERLMRTIALSLAAVVVASAGIVAWARAGDERLWTEV